jgi:3-deoxy-D-manno-octulosonate 8-phosphate phosphatase (KDO 8-P phosphatase)
MSLKEKALKIKAIVLDIDGVLTDGSIGYNENSNEIKFFNVRDGLGITLARRAGLLVGILSGRSSLANRTRAKELKLDFLYEKKMNKNEAFSQLLEDNNLKADECLYIGDDLIDIPPVKRAGIGVAVGDASDDLVKYCDLKAKAFGGKGAVREIIEWLLKEQSKWENIITKYTQD